MRTSVITSTILHCVVLAWAMLSISAPASFEVADVEALPVDIVPVEELTQTQQGAEKAEKKDISAPIPTTRPQTVDNAQNIGDNDVDLKSTPTPITKPTNVEQAAAPEKVEKVQPKQENETNDVKEVQQEQEAAAEPPPPQEVAKAEPVVKPEPKPEVTPEAKPEPAPEKPAEEALPTNVPVPEFKPKQAEAKPETKPVEKPVEKPPEKKAEEKPVDKKVEPTKTASIKSDSKSKDDKKKQETAKSKSSKESDFNADDISALLNKTDAKSGGGKRSMQTASLGTKKSNGGSKLSQSEMDALRGQIENNWSVISGIDGAQGVIIKVTMHLDENGDIIGDPEVVASGGESETARRTLEGSALRAIMKSRPFKGLPRDKYDAWSEVVVNFDPSQLL